jgi:ferredoxin
MLAVDTLTIEIDRDECSACRACEDKAPETFYMDDEDIAVLKKPPADTLEDILDAAGSCPTDAIKIADSQTGERLYPQ